MEELVLRNDNKQPDHPSPLKVNSPGRHHLLQSHSKKKLPPVLEVIPENNPRGLGSNSFVSHSTYQPVHSFSEPQILTHFGKKALVSPKIGERENYYCSEVDQQETFEKDNKPSNHPLLVKKNTNPVSLSHIEGFAQMLMPREPTLFICPYCNTKDYTEVDFVYGGGTCFASFVSGVLCFPFGFFIPYFLTTFKDALHYCPKCSRQVGINKPC